MGPPTPRITYAFRYHPTPTRKSYKMYYLVTIGTKKYHRRFGILSVYIFK
jgi:hypothetical protein